MKKLISLIFGAVFLASTTSAFAAGGGKYVPGRSTTEYE